MVWEEKMIVSKGTDYATFICENKQYFTEDFGNSESFLYAQRLGQLRFILKAAIETIDALYIGDENEHTTPDEPEITFSELFEKWSEEKFSQVIRGKTLAKNTKKSYMNSYHTFLYLHERKFCSLTYDELQNHFDKSKNSFGTQHLEKTLLCQMYQYAVRNQIVKTNIATDLVIRVAPSESKRNVFTADEIASLWKKADDPMVAAVLVLLYTGMRPTELLTIEKKNIHLTDRYMVGGIKTQSGVNRIIPIHRSTSDLIKMLVSKNPKKELLIGVSYNQFGCKQFQVLMKKLGMSHTSYDCRHTFITRANKPSLHIDKGMLKRIVGHSLAGNITESVYTHPDLEDYLTEIDKFYYFSESGR